MSIIPPNDQETLRQILSEKMDQPVKIMLWTRSSKLTIPGQDCISCEDTERLMAEVAGLSDKLSLDVHDIASAPDEAARVGVQRVPTLLLQTDGQVNIRFSGIPAGYEFSEFLATLTALSAGATPLQAQTVNSVKAIQDPVNIQVFVTPT